MTTLDTTRVDVWLWAVRMYKTRSAATAACRGGHVLVNRLPAKAATQVKVGDRIDAFIERKRVLQVTAVIDKRVGAAIATKCFIDQSPPAPVVKRDASVLRRERGTGRPTKRERRDIDRLRDRFSTESR
jgi:ribosome-associated heat shock protein Hsp15